MDVPDTVVYQPWPLDTIREAWEEFSKIMYDGAGPEELAAGLHGMDFLMRASDIPDKWLTIINATLDNARIRINLLLEKEAEERTAEENHKKLVRGIEMLQWQIKSVQQIIKNAGGMDYETIREHIERRREYDRLYRR